MHSDAAPGFHELWQRLPVAELAWLAPEPRGLPVVPLSLDGQPCVALPYMHLATVDTMTDGRAVFCVTDGQLGTAAASVGYVAITHDLSGELFVEQLLDEELIKHPPTRLRADGLMARRENWWWVPRILLMLTGTETSAAVPVRSATEDALLVRERSGWPRVDVVTAQRWPVEDGTRVELWPRDGSLLAGQGEPAYVFGHRHSPDFERWEPWYRSGTLDGQVLTVTVARGLPGTDLAPFGLLERLRNHRGVERQCRSGIAAAEARLRR